MTLREIDMLVAEKVFGWKRKAWGNGNGEWIDAEGNGYPKTPSWATTPSYSKNIAAAWEVVEKACNGWMDLSLESGEWDCCLSLQEPIAEAKATTAPLAICLAALKAVGIEVEVT